MLKKYKFGEYETVHYFRPGKNLDDVSLKRLHTSLVKTNEQSGSNIVNKMLDKTLPLEKIREYLGNTIIGLSLKNNEVYGFLISPILKTEKKLVFHGGLIIIGQNPGVNFVSLLASGNLLMAYEKLGSFYTTNISSTPSIVESFSTLIPGSWPSPDGSQKTPPKGFREVVKILKEEYMDKYFPDSEKLSVDYKRFVLTSNSQEMGFTTDFYKISRADKFKYNLFCHTWINYEKEEDLVQVARMNLLKYIRARFIFYLLKSQLKKRAKKESAHKIQDRHDQVEKKKAA